MPGSPMRTGVGSERWCVSKKASPPNWFANGCGRRFGQSARSGPKGSSECPRGISIASFTRRYYWRDRKSTRLNSSHLGISYAVFCLKKKKHIAVGALQWPDAQELCSHFDLDGIDPDVPLFRPRATTLLFFLNKAATPEIYTLPLHDALPI